MNEKNVKLLFAEKHLPALQLLLQLPNLRLYALELPVRTEDGEKYADMVLECETEPSPLENRLFVLEWKKGLIDIGAVEQVLRYAHFLKLQLYRKGDVLPFIVGEDFSAWECKMAQDNNVSCIQYDLNGHVRLL